MTGQSPRHAVRIRPMACADYDGVLDLWQSSGGIGLSGADSRDAIERYLSRNPELSLVAVRGDGVDGAVLCGHDGRRGYLHHLAVRPAERRAGLARELVRRSLGALSELGLEKCHIFALADNQAGLRFWKQTGFVQRGELQMLSSPTDASP